MRTQKLLFAFATILSLNFAGLTTSAYSTHPLPGSQSNSNQKISAKDQLRIAQMNLFVSMTAAEYGKLRGTKLNFFERISFRLSQHRMKKMLERYEYGDGPGTLQKISWFIKGLLFGPLAIIVAYIFLKDDDRELIKWAWFGFIGFAIIVGIILLM